MSNDVGRFLLEKIEYIKREVDANYSLRKLSKDIGYSTSFLSMVINGKRSLKEHQATEISLKLNFSTIEKDLFVDLVRFNLTGDLQLGQKINDALEIKVSESAFSNLDNDIFCAVSQWLHNAILVLTEVEDFQSDTAWIAKRLAVTELEVNVAMSRLLRLGVLTLKEGKLAMTNSHLNVPAGKSSSIRKYHKQMLKKAEASLEKDPQELREFCGAAIAIDIDKIPFAKKMMRQFLTELSTTLNTGQKSAVYHFAMQLFRVDRNLDKVQLH